jgi:acetyl esterase/lipase
LYRRDVVGGVVGEWVEGGREVSGTMLFLHGGGYIACSPRTHRPFTAWFARRGMRVFAPDYRLAPEHPFPAGLDDAVAVYKGLLEGGVLPAKLAVCGDSAGGGLSLALMLALKAAGLPLPASLALFSPWTDLALTGGTIKTNFESEVLLHPETMPLAAALYANGADTKTPLISPLYGDLAGLPPLFIAASAAEVLLDDSRRLAARAGEAGVAVTMKIWEGMAHDWPLFQFLLPEGRAALGEAGDFAKRHFGGGL